MVICMILDFSVIPYRSFAYSAPSPRSRFTIRYSVPIGCHTFRHSFASHLLEAGYDICIVQKLLGYSDVKTTMVYTLVLNRGGLAVQSPMIGCDFFPNLVKMT